MPDGSFRHLVGQTLLGTLFMIDGRDPTIYASGYKEEVFQSLQ